MSAVELSVVLPAYNEGAVILQSVRQVAAVLEGRDYEIIVVDDGSSDDTFAQARQAAVENARVKVVHYLPNRGKGHALKQGFANSSGELVAFLDADADLHPRQLFTLWDVMKQENADVVIGSKMHPDSKLEYPAVRRFISWSYFSMAHFLFGLPVRDTQTGIKLFRRQVLGDVFPHLQIEGFAFDLELLVAAHVYGYKIAEAPVELAFAAQDTRPLTLARASAQVAWDTLRVFYQTSFWTWLRPSWQIKFWALILIIGLIGGSVGLTHVLNNFHLPAPLESIANILLLRFLERTLRDIVLIGGGITLMLVAAIQLNKHIVLAFSRKDRTNFWERKDR